MPTPASRSSTGRILLIAAALRRGLAGPDRRTRCEVLRRWMHQLGLRFAAPDVLAGIAVASTAPTDPQEVSR